MRILFLSTWFPYPPDNGSKIRAYHLLRALADTHQVTLVAFCPTNAGSNGECLVSELGIESMCPVPTDPFQHVSLPQALKFVSPIPVAFWPSRPMRQAVANVTTSGQWDAVVAVQASVARYALQLSGVPRILDVDTSLSYQMHTRHIDQGPHLMNRFRTWISWQKAQQYETRLFREFQACTVVSPSELGHVQAMTKASGCRVVVSPNGVDCRHNRPNLAQPQADTLIYNGALTYSANYDAMQFFLEKVYPLIRRQVPKVSLTITGSTAGVDLSGLALDESVRLSGYVDDVRLPVSQASVCVVPIREGGGTRLKILEAMALGTPVVATSKGAEGLDVEPDRDILIGNAPSEFAAQVVRLLRDEVLHQQLAVNARRLVEQRYDWSWIGQQFVKLVEDAVDGHIAKGASR